MKPQHLRPPFTWEDRSVLVKDRIWHIPPLCETNSFTFHGWHDPLFFGNDKPVYLEYCSGNGTWIAEKAKQFPLINWVGLEKQWVRARKIASKAHNLDLDNLMVVCAEGMHATETYLQDESIDQIFINFPDPWPKKRHAKHRIIQKPFLDQMARILKKRAKVVFVTDDPDYSQLTIDEFLAHSGFESDYPDPYYKSELEGYGTSFFDTLWREKGRKIHYHQFSKI